MMDLFDRLNWETREYNNRNVDRFNTSSCRYGSREYWQNYWNAQTSKTNNGDFLGYYTRH